MNSVKNLMNIEGLKFTDGLGGEYYVRKTAYRKTTRKSGYRE